MLRVRLIGALEVELDGAVIDASASHRPWALFGYLALAGRPVTRAELAERFWPDVLDQSARASLRSALWALRRRLGDTLAVTADRVDLAHSDGVWIDVHAFARHAATAPHQALELCRGELLEGVEDEWALLARARHREQEIALLERLAAAADADGDADTAIALTRRQEQRDPLDEAAARRLMQRLIAHGDRAGAVRAYRGLTDRLARELGVAPSAATRTLGQSLAQPPAPASTLPAGGPLPLVGRARELAALQNAWATGAGGVAILRGPAGIGKTRLAAELRHRAAASGARTAIGTTLDLGGAAPLRPWAELLAELLPQLPAPEPDATWPGDLAVLVGALPDHFPALGTRAPQIAPDLQRTRLFEAVVAALEWAARQGPSLVVLEDVHAADGPTLELAAYVTRRLFGRPLLLVLTRRDLPRRSQADTLEVALRSGGRVACELDLPPLSRSDATALARAVSPLTAGDLHRVVERTEGNALLTVETARAVALGHTEIAPSVRGSVRSALGAVSDEGRILIDLLAIAARTIGAAELRALALANLDEAGPMAFETGLLHSGNDQLGFRHALLRDAAYEEIPTARRAALHQRWASALTIARRDAAAEIAHHLRLAGADTEAVPHLIEAAARARRIGALGAASGYVQEALSIDPDRSALWLEIGELEAWRSRLAPAERAFDHALSGLRGAAPIHRARAWLRRAQAFHGALCVPRDVLRCATHALQALDEIPSPPRTERNEALGALAWAQAVTGDLAGTERTLERLETDRGAEPDHLLAYHAGHARALALLCRGRFVDSYTPAIAAGEAVQAAERPDLAYGCWSNAAGAANAAGDHARALAFLDRAMQAVAGHGLRAIELQLLGQRAFVLSRCGRVQEAYAAAQDEQVLAGELGDGELSAVACHDLGLVALAQGEFPAAAEQLGAALDAQRAISRPRTRLARAEALARGGDGDGAAQELRALVLEPVRPSDFPAALVAGVTHVQGLIALAGGDFAAARARFDESIAGWTRVRAQAIGPETMVAVLADLGRPVVGLIEPEHELAQVQADRDRCVERQAQGEPHAVVP